MKLKSIIALFLLLALPVITLAAPEEDSVIIAYVEDGDTSEIRSEQSGYQINLSIERAMMDDMDSKEILTQEAFREVESEMDEEYTRVFDNSSTIILAIVLAIIGVWYTYRCSKKTDININDNYERIDAKLECMINRKVQDGSFSICFDPAAQSYREIYERARPLLNSLSSYERGISKATILNDLESAEFEFSIAINESRPTLSKYYFQRGNVRSLQTKYEEACQDYSEAIKLEPQIVYGWTNKSAALCHLGRYQEAFKASEKAIELNPEDAIAWGNRGSILIHLHEYKEALNAYDEAIKLDPKNLTLQIDRCTALGRLGKHQESLDSLEKVIEIDPNNAKAWDAKGVALGRLGKDVDALKAFNKAIEFDPKLANAWRCKGLALIHLYIFDEALKAFDEAIKIYPKSADVLGLKGYALMQLIEYETAIEAFDEAIKLDPKFALAWLSKGSALKHLGRYEEAAIAIRHAFELEPKIDPQRWIQESLTDEDIRRLTLQSF